MIIWIVSLVFITFYAGMILYFHFGWQKASLPRLAEKAEPEGISVIIAARNEQQHIGRVIGNLLFQEYPDDKMEIIIVDDHSTDDMVSAIKSYHDKRIRIVYLADHLQKGYRGNAYKKQAIAIGIQQARFPLIVTTDADCKMNGQYLQTYIDYYRQYNPLMATGPAIIEPPTAFVSGWQRFLVAFQCLDSLAMAFITGATLALGKAVMCNGANLFYPKKSFIEARGFDGIDHIPSGDDVLLMQKFKKKYNTVPIFIMHPRVVVFPRPEYTLKSFINQRKRWVSKAGNYHQSGITTILVFAYLYNTLLPVLAVMAVFDQSMIVLFFSFLVVKFILEASVIYLAAKQWQMKKVLRWFVPVSLAYIPYVMVVGFLGIFTSHTWKNRHINP